jgi:hypothetical protein
MVKYLQMLIVAEIAGCRQEDCQRIASVIYNLPAMAVDTHVHRVSARIGLTTNAKNPLQTEMQLIKHIPKEAYFQGTPLADFAWPLCLYCKET